MVLTGNTEAELINAVYDLGASYVVKPVNSARIERVCREIASAKKGDRAATASPDPSAVPASLDGCIIRLRELLPLRIDPLVRYAIGAIIAEVKAKPELYGTSAVTAVAAALGEDTPSLYRHAAVAECWTEAGVRALLARTGGNGRSLTWSHAVLLGNVRSPIARRRLENRALEEGLSVRQLAELVEAEG